MNDESYGRDEALDRKLDWAMGELERGEAAPDVVDAVMARHARGKACHVQLMRTEQRPALASAAIALLGLAVVTWLLLQDPVSEPDEATGMQALVVTSLEQIPKLPRDAEAVELRRLGDVAVDRLIDRCPDLIMIGVRNGETLSSNIGHTLRTRLPRLREVRLIGCPRVDDIAIAEVIALPTLRKLEIDGRYLTEKTFQLLLATRQLRSIGLGEAAWLTVDMAERLMMTGKRVRARHGNAPGFARALAALRQRNEHRMDKPVYHVVHELADIENLPTGIEYVEVRKLGDRATALLAKRTDLRGLSYIRDDKGGFTGESMRLLATMTSLEELRLGNVMKWDGAGMARLAKLVNLRKLDISSAPVADDGLAVLAQMPALRDLELVGLRKFGTKGLEHVAACKHLTRLRLTGCDQLTDRQLTAVAKLTTLRELDVTQTQFGERGVTALAPLANLERLYLGKCEFSATAARSLSGMRKLAILELRENTSLENATLLELPVSLRELHLSMCEGLDGAASSILRDRFPCLAKLNLASAKWLTDEGLAQILANHALNDLSVNSCTELTNRSFASLRDARHLHRLSAVVAGRLTEAKLTELQQLRPDMKITKRAW